VDRAPWSPRGTFKHIVHDGKIWILGGNVEGKSVVGANDVWYSENGVDWKQVTESAPWGPRAGSAAFSLPEQNIIGICQGFTYEPRRQFYDDVWISTDGQQWEVVNNPLNED
jgi:hypothetical protein